MTAGFEEYEYVAPGQYGFSRAPTERERKMGLFEVKKKLVMTIEGDEVSVVAYNERGAVDWARKVSASELRDLLLFRKILIKTAVRALDIQKGIGVRVCD